MCLGLLWVAPILVVRPTDVRAVRGIGVLLCGAFVGVCFCLTIIESGDSTAATTGLCARGGGIMLHPVRHYMHRTACWSLNIHLGVAVVLGCLSAPLGFGVGVLTSFTATSPASSSSSSGGAARGARTVALFARITPRVNLQQSRHLISVWLLLTTLVLAISMTALIIFQVTETTRGPADPLVVTGVVMVLLPTAALLVSSRRLRGASQWWLGMHGKRAVAPCNGGCNPV